MSAAGHSRRFRDVGYESALPPRTDIVGETGHVGKVPRAEVWQCPNDSSRGRHSSTGFHVCKGDFANKPFRALVKARFAT